MPVQNVERLREMQRQRFEESLTLDQIATIHGVSRERVRQLLGDTGGYIKTKRMIDNERVIQNGANKTNSELCAELGITETTLQRYGRTKQVHEFKTGSWLDRHYQVVKYICDILEYNNICTQIQPMASGINILTGSSANRVAVRTTACEIKAPSIKSRAKSPMWRFNTILDFSKIDFFIFAIIPTMDLFVVPEHVVGRKTSMHFCWPTSRPEISKIVDYYNNFDPLRV